MTVSTTTIRYTYVGNNSTKVFSFPTYFVNGSDIKVYLRDSNGLDTLQNSGYTITGDGTTNGTVTFVTAPTNSQTVVLLLDPQELQANDYVPNDTFSANRIENNIDKLTQMIQRIRFDVDRTWHGNPGDTAWPILASRAARVSKYIAFDTNGDPVLSAGTAGIAGIAGPTGATGAAGTNGTNGYSVIPGNGPPTTQGSILDTYFDVDTGNVYWKLGVGDYALLGNIHGKDGATWRSGSGAPSNGLGINGDFYVDAAGYDIYLKSGGVYSIQFNIKGATGAQGPTGAKGDTGAVGPDAGLLTGSFTATINGLVGPVTGTIHYSVVAGALCTLHSRTANLYANASSTTITVTGLPSDVKPAQNIFTTGTVVNNTIYSLAAHYIAAGSGTLQIGLANTNGAYIESKYYSSLWNVGQLCGLPLGWTITYPIL